jgi:hypothetical protein
MVECNSTSKMVCQRIREDWTSQSRDCCENSRTSKLSRWQQILATISAYAEANTRKYDKYDKYEPVLLGGGSYMLIRCDPESIFREEK